jgi:erythromycin esterase
VARRFYTLGIWFCSLGVLPGCGGPSAPPGTSPQVAPASTSAPVGPCVVEGTVRSASGEPVNGALVAIIVPYASAEKAVVRTTPSGAFCFAGIEHGEYSLTATAPAGAAASVEPFATQDRSRGLDLRLGASAMTLRGTVKGENVGNVARARVRFIRESDGQFFVVESDAEGHFAAQLPPGAYWPEVETPTAAVKSDRILLDRDAIVDLVLEPRNPPGMPPPDAVVDWARQHAVALSSVEPGSGFEDLEPLRAMVAGARLVGIGEASHGTHEFRALSRRLLEFFVERMGFRAVVVEDSFAEGLADGDYVRGAGVDDAHRSPLLNWIRKRNKGKAEADKLRYFGNDLRQPARSVTALAQALRSVDEKLWAEVEAGLEPLADDWSTFIDVQFEAPRSPRQDATLAAAEKVAARLDERRRSDVQKLGAERWALARVHAHVLADFARLMKTKTFEVRDRSMAENTVRLLDTLGPGARAVVLAHNVHVQKVAPGPGEGPQGKHLRDLLGDGYFVFGTAFDHGSFNAPGQGNAVFTLGPAPPGSFDGMLASLGQPLLALDLRSAEGVASRWLHTSTLARFIAAVYDEARPEAFFDPAPPAERLDAVIFVAQSTPLEAVAPSAPGAPPASRASSDAPSGQLLNGDFEMGSVGDAPPGWQLSSEPPSLTYRARLGRFERRAAAGELAVLLDREATPTPVGYASLTQTIEARALRGRRVRVSARVRLEASAIGDKAFVFAMAELGSLLPHAISAQVSPSKAWSRSAVLVDVPMTANALKLGVVVTGGARAAVDDVQLELVDPEPK